MKWPWKKDTPYKAQEVEPDQEEVVIQNGSAMGKSTGFPSDIKPTMTLKRKKYRVRKGTVLDVKGTSYRVTSVKGNRVFMKEVPVRK